MVPRYSTKDFVIKKKILVKGNLLESEAYKVYYIHNITLSFI